MNTKIGSGYDIHRLIKGRKLILGGVDIPYELGLDGHSDADVLIHAIIDAMLGAVAAGDIGSYFPPSDPQYKDIDSKILLAKVNNLIFESGYKIGNIDSTIIVEKPRLRDYIDPMRANLADILNIQPEQISIKAKTAEGCGVIGEHKAIAAQAVVLLFKNL